MGEQSFVVSEAFFDLVFLLVQSVMGRQDRLIVRWLVVD
jgi:hypothetical protein